MPKDKPDSGHYIGIGHYSTFYDKSLARLYRYGTLLQPTGSHSCNEFNERYLNKASPLFSSPILFSLKKSNWISGLDLY